MGWYERYTAWSERHRFGVDLTGTLVWALFAVPVSAFTNGLDDTSSGVLALSALALVAPLPWRRTQPVISAAIVYAVAYAHVLAGVYLVFPADATVLIALYSVTVYGPRWAHKVAIVASLVGSVLTAVLNAGQYANTSVDLVASAMFLTALMSMTFVAVWAFALMRRGRFDTLTALRDRAERLEVERDQQARIATANERARIAREMHDIVAHSLSVIIAQADGGRYAAAADPQAAQEALATVADTGRAALADMRRLLGVLRSDDASDDQAALVPQPESQNVEELVAEARASGLRVSLVRTGTPRPLPPGAGLTVYRVCQESLTNVLKHAGPDPTVTVGMHWLPDALVVEVIDDGRGAAADTGSPGFGLVGMNERAALFGGTVTAGPQPGGGFRVRFRMPLPRA